MTEAVWKELFAGGGVTLVRADYPPGYVHPPHSHDFTSVTLILSGGVEEQVGSGTARGGPLGVVLKEAGVEHACRWGRTGTRTLSLEIEPGPLAEFDGLPSAPWIWQRGGDAAACLVGFFRAWERGNLAGNAPDLVIELIASLGDPDATRDGEPPPWLGVAEEALRAASPRRPSIRWLAAHAGVHPVYFARAFRRHVGLSPTRYARWLRLEAATQALITERSHISRIAHRCGFADHSHLCREVRSSLHTSPSRLRALGAPVPAVET